MLVQAALVQGIAPWWGVPLLGAFFTIMGIAVSYFFTIRNERRRVKRDDVTYWREQLRSACSTFLAVASATYMRVKRVTKPEDDEDMSALLQAYANIQLTAPTSIVMSAELVRNAIFASEGIDGKREWEVMQGTGYLHAIDNFTRVVRGELGVEEVSPVVRTQVVKVTHIRGVDDDDEEEFVVAEPDPSLMIVYEED